MRRKFSVLAMIAGHTLGKVFAILLLLPVINGILFYRELGEAYQPLYKLLDENQFLLSFLAVFALLSIVLCGALRDKGGNQNCLLNRLSISPRGIYWNHVLYNSLCYLLLFAVEGLSLLGLAFWNRHAFPDYYNHQTLMLDTYQTNLLHLFFPLSDWLSWVILAVMILGLGICTAAMPTMNRRGKRSVSPFFMAATVAFYLLIQFNSSALFLDGKVIGLIVGIFVPALSVLGPMSQEVTADE